MILWNLLPEKKFCYYKITAQHRLFFLIYKLKKKVPLWSTCVLSYIGFENSMRKNVNYWKFSGPMKMFINFMKPLHKRAVNRLSFAWPRADSEPKLMNTSVQSYNQVLGVGVAEITVLQIQQKGWLYRMNRNKYAAVLYKVAHSKPVRTVRMK